MLRKLAILALFVSVQTYAQCNSQDAECVPVGDWQFSVALGAGVLTNPLHGGKHIPLVVIPYVSYYGEKFFIENTTAGFTLVDNPTWNISPIIQLNNEQAFFERWHPNNIFVGNAQVSFINGEIAADNSQRSIDISEVSKRNWAIDGGVLINWYINTTSQLSTELLHDISNVHQGSLATFRYTKIISLNQVQDSLLKLGLGASWKSRKLTDYYYGINERDTENPMLHYLAGSGWSPNISLAYMKQLTSNWQLKANLKREFLSTAISDSPLVKTHHVDTLFFGVKYVY
ncbi:MipA/OmpV family protein [Thalassotalea fusca]